MSVRENGRWRVAAGGDCRRNCWPAKVSLSSVTSKQVGSIVAAVGEPTQLTLEQVEATPVRYPDLDAAARMIALIEEVRKEQDSIGGICELLAAGVPAGLGEPVFDKLKADLSEKNALYCLCRPVMAFEYGAGFAVATARRQHRTLNDTFIPKTERTPPIGTAIESSRRDARRHQQRRADCVPRWRSNRRAALPQVQETVTRAGEPTEILTRGRHDPCLLPRFVPMGEAMMALVDHWLRWQGCSAVKLVVHKIGVNNKFDSAGGHTVKIKCYCGALIIDQTDYLPPLDLPTNGGHSVKGVYSPLEVHHGSNATYLHP